MSTEHTRTLVRQILVWLDNRHSRWQRGPQGPASDLHERVHRILIPFSEAQLEGLLLKKLEFDSLQMNRYLFLEPIDEGASIVPVLSFGYSFQRSKAELRLRLALFVPHDNDLAAIGFRFEPPEGPGTHNYYHAQMFREFHGGGAGPCLPSCPPWLPTSRPAFHLKADDPVTLLISMVISLYGIDRVQEFRQATFANDLKSCMDKLCPRVPVGEDQPAAGGPINRRVRRGHG
jgi:hypothetical protein